MAPVLEPMTAADESSITAQLERTPRGVAGIAYRCPCGQPAVVATLPRLADGTPFPTTYYLTCRRATAACSTLEAEGVMTQMKDRLDARPGARSRPTSRPTAATSATGRCWATCRRSPGSVPAACPTG